MTVDERTNQWPLSLLTADCRLAGRWFMRVPVERWLSRSPRERRVGQILSLTTRTFTQINNSEKLSLSDG